MHKPSKLLPRIRNHNTKLDPFGFEYLPRAFPVTDLFATVRYSFVTVRYSGGVVIYGLYETGPGRVSVFYLQLMDASFRWGGD